MEITINIEQLRDAVSELYLRGNGYIVVDGAGKIEVVDDYCRDDSVTCLASAGELPKAVEHADISALQRDLQTELIETEMAMQDHIAVQRHAARELSTRIRLISSYRDALKAALEEIPSFEDADEEPPSFAWENASKQTRTIVSNNCVYRPDEIDGIIRGGSAGLKEAIT